jgi:ATP-dependent RNA helicase RhlE
MRNFNRGGYSGRQNRPARRFGGNGRRGGSGGNKYINPALFINRANGAVVEPYEPKNSFADFPLSITVKENLEKRGFVKPTAIQDQAIIPILNGRDLVGIANTGTGKTAAFLLPLITKTSSNRNEKVLIITPTRELAAQIQDEFKLFSENLRVYSTLCIGGASLRNQSRELSRRPQFVIGTPGRIMDLEKRRILRLNDFSVVVLDEVDRMLDMGFIHDIKHIVSLLSKPRQSLFFSATMPNETKAIMQTFLQNPEMIEVKQGKTPVNVDQDIVRMQGRNKLDVLHELLEGQEFKKVLVFGRTKRGVNQLEKGLLQRGLKAIAIHGNKSQGQRTRALEMLKNDRVQVLLATDVASRGIDIDDVTHVINYDLPGTYDDYVHRIGRTGRLGKKGVALTFVE